MAYAADCIGAGAAAGTEPLSGGLYSRKLFEKFGARGAVSWTAVSPGGRVAAPLSSDWPETELTPAALP